MLMDRGSLGAPLLPAHDAPLNTTEPAEVAVPRALFTAILRRLDRLRGPPVPAT